MHLSGATVALCPLQSCSALCGSPCLSPRAERHSQPPTRPVDTEGNTDPPHSDKNCYHCRLAYRTADRIVPIARTNVHLSECVRIISIGQSVWFPWKVEKPSEKKRVRPSGPRALFPPIVHGLGAKCAYFAPYPTSTSVSNLCHFNSTSWNRSISVFHILICGVAILLFNGVRMLIWCQRLVVVFRHLPEEVFYSLALAWRVWPWPRLGCRWQFLFCWFHSFFSASSLSMNLIFSVWIVL